MLFNSFEFLVFFAIVYFAYWKFFAKHVHARNWFILVASYVFYGWWDPRFLILMFFSSLVDYSIGAALSIAQKASRRKLLLAASITVNLGVLGFFKYFNFFQEELISLFSSIGIGLNPWSVKIILPVGISFYTFQTLSYTIDVYRRQLEPSKNVVAFFAFVSFFPQLVAGPIERASNLLPQFKKKYEFKVEDQKAGLRQMLWGFFKKLVIADNCAPIVNEVFGNYTELDSITLFFGVLLFAFQIYADFSGYSDIAIGLARLFGFHLMRNFAYPYFSRDMAEFWRRWHISLSTWFRDYLYIPLGGSRGSLLKKIRNVFVIFIVSGFWHGANWTFIAWGAINALLFLPLFIVGRNRKNLDIIAENKHIPTMRELIGIATTFTFTCLAWVFFRAANMSEAIGYIGRIFNPKNLELSLPMGISLLLPIVLLLIIEWFSRKKHHPLEFESWNKWQRWLTYYALIAMIIYYFPTDKAEFIYFQF